MKKIDGCTLRKLREAKGWTQEDLAKKTTRIDKQTISRLERGERSTTRQGTIELLASVLRVEPGVLTGERPMPEVGRRVDTRSKLEVRIAAAPRNALHLVADRYRVERSQIVELAPYLFLCAAEASQRRRRKLAEDARKALDDLEACARQLPHLPGLSEHAYQTDALCSDDESTNRRDLFGRSIELVEVAFDFDEETDNPFTVYLRKIGEQCDGAAKFERWSGSGVPQYRVCPDEAAELVGGDQDRAEEILTGQAALNEMPKEIRQPEMTDKRAEWVRLQAEEYRKESERASKDFLDSLFDGLRSKR
jgi:transcriptional regulator with XRE-family HTH domain